MVKIMLDPGHGGGPAHNRGFKQVDNLPYCNEGDCNFIYARDFLKPELERYGFKVNMTRNYIFQNPSLKARGLMAGGYDLLLSVHSNAAGGNVRGVEVWDSTNPKESCKTLGDKICAYVSNALGTPNRGTKYRKNNAGSNYYGILRLGYAKKNMIVEHVFHDNLQDATIYRKNLDKTANAVAKAIAEFYGLAEKTGDAKTPPIELTEEKFIQSIVDSLKGQKLNILPSVTIAQAILESNWGKSSLAREACNLFGIKASKDWTGQVYKKQTKEQKPNGEVYTISADFRKYGSYLESIKDHDKFFVSTPWRKENYKKVLEAKNYKTQALALRECGYATDLNYGHKLIQLIERLGLQQYDKGVGKIVTRDNSVPSEWAKEDWEWGKEQGITDGSNPGGTCTREQVISMIRRYDKQKEK
jgi:flagellum-specific peptidoglycan hydrolase FlgJ